MATVRRMTVYFIVLLLKEGRLCELKRVYFK
jgi:hypothetical protein